MTEGNAGPGSDEGETDATDSPRCGPWSDGDLELVLREHGLFEWLDLRVERFEPGRAVFEVRSTRRSATPGPGGSTGLSRPWSSTPFGVRHPVHIRRPRRGPSDHDGPQRPVRRAGPLDLRVDAEAVRVGGSMAVTECDVTTVHRASGWSSS